MGEAKVAELLRDLSAAEALYEGATADYAVASRRQNEALNKLNEAQKALSVYVETLKANAPRGSDWRVGRAHGLPDPTR